jgi:putative membrane protein
VATAALMAPMGYAAAQGAASGSMGAGTSSGASKALDSADRKFVDAAAQGSVAEVAMGQMAQQRGSNVQVKEFGQRMVIDHSKASDELKKVADAKGMKLPTAPASSHQHDADKLAKLSGTDFDRAYMKHMLDDHKKDVADFEKAAKSAKDADVKDFAARTLPTLQSHLQLAQSTYDAVK